MEWLEAYRPRSGDSSAVNDFHHGLLDLGLTGGILELRLQAAVEARIQERHTLMGLTVHEWVNKLADGLARSEKLKEAAILADLDDSIMDHVYGLYGTLHGDIGLPWILDQTHRRGRGQSRYFTVRAASEDDIWFLRMLFEFHVRALLNARQQPGPLVALRFRCDTFTGADCDLELGPHDKGLAEVGRRLDRLLVVQPAPWPLDESVGFDLTAREGILSALTLAPREALRNAIRHGSTGDPKEVVNFTLNVSLEQAEILATVRNGVTPGADIDKRLADMRGRCSQLQNAVPFATCSPSYDDAIGDFVVQCRLTIGQRDHE